MGRETMSIEKITSKIIADAREQALAIAEDAKMQCDEILANAEKEAAAILEDGEKRGQEEKEKRIQRKKAVADIDGRKLVLETKQKLIASCFEKAEEALHNMEEERYIAFLARVITSTEEASGEVILSAGDRAQIGDKLIAALKEQLPQGKFTLAEETRETGGGLFLKKGQVYLNCTISAFLEEAREQLIGQVAQQLFQ